MASGNAIRFLGTGSDDQALALKFYMGKFVEAPRSSIFLYDRGLPVISRQMVTAGKSFQFLMDGDIPDPEDFEPGDEMMGQQYAVEEGTITVDKYLVAHTLIPRDQFKISHFDILGRLARKHKLKIGRAYDRRLMITAAKAARATTAVTKNGLAIHSGGNSVTRGGGAVATAYARSSTGASNFRADLRTLGGQMDVDNIDPENRYMMAQPYIKEVLQYDTTAQLFSEDYVDPETNRINQRKITLVEGFKILGWPNTTTNNGPLPDQNITSGLSKYQGNFTPGASTGTPVAIALTNGDDGSAAVGLVEFEGIQHVVKYIDERLCWLVMSYALCGVGQLNPWCAGSVEVIT